MSRRTSLHTWLVLSVFLSGMVVPNFAAQIFVDVNAQGNNDGSSWVDAYTCLQDALAAASSSDEVLVAKGIYKPDQGKGISPGDQAMTFQLIDGVTIKGGYAGVSYLGRTRTATGDAASTEFVEPDPNIRDVNEYETILSGDLAGNDGPNLATSSENSYHVVTGSGTGETALLDGVTITGGGVYNKSGNPRFFNCTFRANCGIFGGGMRNYNSSPTLIDCRFIGNLAINSGGGIYNFNSSPKLINCTFINNSALNGGGIYCKENCHPTLTNCTFSGNTARYSGAMANYINSNPRLSNCTFSNNSAGYGAAMRNYQSNPTLVNCKFLANSATGEGGGMDNKSSSPILSGCIFSENTAAEYGAGMRNSASSPQLSNCTFSRNSAGHQGGGIFNDKDSNPTITNCVLWLNRDISGNDESAQLHTTGGTVVVNYCCIQGWTGSLGGTGNIGAEPLFVNPAAGDYHLLPNSPCINAGDPNYTATDEATDIDGEPRIINSRVDMGADEYNNHRLVPSGYATIQSAIDAAYDGDIIIISPGTYTGKGNRDIDFKGKSITVRSIDPEDPNIVATTIIDCGNEGRGFYFHHAEGATSIVDGLSITNGNAANGGGVYCVQSSPTLRNCILSGNWAKYGGGMHNDNSNPRLSNCSFSANLAYYGGGGIYNDSSSPRLTHCIFSGNWARYGGGVHNCDGSSPRLSNCKFSNNSTTNRGGGMDNYNSNPILTDCTFSKNLANGSGGGMHNQGSNVTLTNCTFSDNLANASGGGMFSLYGKTTLSYCIFKSNSVGNHGGGMFTGGSSPVLSHCTFSGNWSQGSGGGMFNRDGKPQLSHCIFSGNRANSNGGGMTNNDSPILTNCTFSGNLAQLGGGIYNQKTSNVSNPQLSNCIFWNNIDSSNVVMLAQIYGGTPVISYSCIQDDDPNDSNVYPGIGNIDDDPCFVKLGYWSHADDSSSKDQQPGRGRIWVEGDYHLLGVSPCIDAGNPNSDFLSEPEPNGGRINIGAYGNTPEAASKGR